MFDRYINIKYKHRGRDFKGVDCFGLCYLIFKDKLNIILPDFLDISYNETWYEEEKNFILDTIGTFDTKIWDITVHKPFKIYDCLIFYMSKSTIANHCGLYIGNNKIIHIYENTTSRVDRLDSRFLRLYGAVRYKVLNKGCY